MTQTVHRKRGNLGEDIAADFLIKKGFRIIARQWRCPIGEIDIVALRDARYAFIEVKTKQSGAYGMPELEITAAKARKLARLAEYYLAALRKPAAVFQIDVIAVELRGSSQALVRHHENALADLPFLDRRRLV